VASRCRESRRPRSISALAALSLATVLLISGACSDDESPTEDATSPSATATFSASQPATASLTPTPQPPPLTARFTNSSGDTVDLSIEIADTPAERSTGLMNRESLPEDAGMLFDFGNDTNAGFWMRNTLIPLSIAFISSNGVILHIEDMEPLDKTLHYSPSLYRYAIEVNQGWFDRNGIAVGDAVEFNAG
jgi:uncharacterized membrane protein (UPF0127 family)